MVVKFHVLVGALFFFLAVFFIFFIVLGVVVIGKSLQEVVMFLDHVFDDVLVGV